MLISCRKSLILLDLSTKTLDIKQLLQLYLRFILNNTISFELFMLSLILTKIL